MFGFHLHVQSRGFGRVRLSPSTFSALSSPNDRSVSRSL